MCPSDRSLSFPHWRHPRTPPTCAAVAGIPPGCCAARAFFRWCRFAQPPANGWHPSRDAVCSQPEASAREETRPFIVVFHFALVARPGRLDRKRRRTNLVAAEGCAKSQGHDHGLFDPALPSYIQRTNRFPPPYRVHPSQDPAAYASRLTRCCSRLAAHRGQRLRSIP